MNLITFYNTAIKSINTTAMQDDLNRVRHIQDPESKRDYLQRMARTYQRALFIEAIVLHSETIEEDTCGVQYGLNVQVRSRACRNSSCKDCIRAASENLRFFDDVVKESNDLITDDICDYLDDLL